MDISILTGTLLTVASVFLLCTFLWSHTIRRLLWHYNETGVSVICHGLHTLLWLLLNSIRNARSKQVSRVQPQRLSLQEMRDLKGVHEVADLLDTLVRTDGAGTWPPAADHSRRSWPKALRPYGEIYEQMAHLLPQASPSLDDDINKDRIAGFRETFRQLLEERVNLVKVIKLFEATDDDRCNGFSAEAYNAVYCCIAVSRHAYRWGSIPVVRVAQMEKELDLPKQLQVPWKFMQRRFGCTSDSGNNTSNLVLNFDMRGCYIYMINAGMSQKHLIGEEAFARIFYDVELLGVPIYLKMVRSIIAFARDDRSACARHVYGIASQLRLVLGSYFDNLHDKVIAQSVWLSHIQGFQAWGIGSYDQATGDWEKFDGLSGNQVLLFQALDAFLGIEQYLSPRDQQRNVPGRQREFCHALRKHSFRVKLLHLGGDPAVQEINRYLDEIVVKLRLFRAAHRTRAGMYLSQPAPERLHMTAGKSLLKPSLDESLADLDEFMVRHLAKTV